MLETDMLRQVLYQQAITAVQNNGNFPCKIGNEPFKKPSDGSIYGEFWFKTGKTTQMELGSRRGFECTAGVAQFALFSPEKDGEGAVQRLADNLRKVFNRKQYTVPPDGYLNMDPWSVQTVPGTRNGYIVVIVDGSFDFYHRDPSATP